MWGYLLESWRTLLAAALLFALGLILIWSPHISVPDIAIPDFRRAPAEPKMDPMPSAAPVTKPSPAAAPAFDTASLDPACRTPGPEVVAAAPEGDPATWFTTDDYPAEALRKDEQGLVVIRYRVALDGRVDQCTVVTPSASASLNAASCNILRERARFTPAHDARGCPVPSYSTRRIRWQLPGVWPFGR